MPEVRTPVDAPDERQAEDARSVPIQGDDGDEYVVSYVHNGKKLHVMYVDYDDNRAAAMDSALRTARSDGVKNLRVYRRPKGGWTPVDWRGSDGVAGATSND